jgi:hypothetical protein
MNGKTIWTVLPLAIIALAAAVLWNHGGPPASALAVACADPLAGCITRLGDREIRIGMQANPEAGVKPLQPFQVWVQAPAARKVQVSFTMEGMDMGFNLYTLHPDAQGVFRARATLPVCVTGRRDWNMVVDIDGTLLQVPFTTNL